MNRRQIEKDNFIRNVPQDDIVGTSYLRRRITDEGEEVFENIALDIQNDPMAPYKILGLLLSQLRNSRCGKSITSTIGTSLYNSIAGIVKLIENDLFDMNDSKFYDLIFSFAKTMYPSTITANFRPHQSRIDNNVHTHVLLHYWCFMTLLTYETTRVQQLFSDIYASVGVSSAAKVFQKFHDFDHVNGLASAPPIMVFVDHLSHSIVVGVRGSTTMADFITDAMGEMVPLSLVPELIGYFDSANNKNKKIAPTAHRGFLQAAVKLFRDADVQQSINQHLEEYRDYSLKVIGHSYGAAVASILHILLTVQHSGKHQPLAILFETPPTWSDDAVQIINESGTQVSVINCYDIVPNADISRVSQWLGCDAGDRLYVPGTIKWMRPDDQGKARDTVTLNALDRDPYSPLSMIVRDAFSSFKNHSMLAVLGHLRAKYFRLMQTPASAIVSSLIPLPGSFLSSSLCDSPKNPLQSDSQKFKFWSRFQNYFYSHNGYFASTYSSVVTEHTPKFFS